MKKSLKKSSRRFSSSSSPYSKTGKMLVEVVTGTDTREDLNQKCAHVPWIAYQAGSLQSRILSDRLDESELCLYGSALSFKLLCGASPLDVSAK